MKRKNIFILISLFAYCLLFYKQSAGINVFLFSILIIAGLLVLDKTLVKSRNWILVAAGVIITSVSAFLYGSTLACIGNVIALLLVANLSTEKESSIFFSFLQSAFSYVAFPFIKIAEIITNWIENDDLKKQERKSFFSVGNLLKFLIPSVILLFFFFVYRNSNPVFANFVNSLHIEISWSFIRFLLVGFFLIYIFFNQYKQNYLIEADKSKGNLLLGVNHSEKTLFRIIDTEFSSAILTFSMLNGLLLIVNLLDIKFILFDDKNIHDYSKYIHQGVNSSIFSVLIAILVTLYFFRGNLNFYAKNKSLKLVALVWIAQNIILLVTCVHKNYSYIYEFGLTQKRIGVYFYLLVTFIGLLLTWIKITQLKSNMYLVRTNTWSLFMILVCSSLFNWNRIILHHNTTYKSTIEREYYLEFLPETSLPFLLNKWEKLPIDRHSYPGDRVFEKQLKKQVKKFIHQYEAKGWQSWNLEDDRIYREIQQSVII